MDREILFRGQDVATGDWIKGFYVHLFDDKGNDSHRIYLGYAETDCEDYYPDFCEVDPETVGQFTGMIDSTGNKVFEGDILEAYTYKKRRKHRIFLSEVYYENGAFYIRFMEHGVALLSGLINSFNFEGEGTFSKVIGNIHDNPELLKGC